jgi:hypothetical protein
VILVEFEAGLENLVKNFSSKLLVFSFFVEDVVFYMASQSKISFLFSETNYPYLLVQSLTMGSLNQSMISNPLHNCSTLLSYQYQFKSQSRTIEKKSKKFLSLSVQN